MAGHGQVDSPPPLPHPTFRNASNDRNSSTLNPKQADMDGNGRVDFSEFCTICDMLGLTDEVPSTEPPLNRAPSTKFLANEVTRPKVHTVGQIRGA